jgi:hypothetical protein
MAFTVPPRLPQTSFCPRAEGEIAFRLRADLANTLGEFDIPFKAGELIEPVWMVGVIDLTPAATSQASPYLLCWHVWGF